MSPTVPTDVADPASRVRQLLLSGDNMIKNRDDDRRFARAAERYRTAREVAAAGGLDGGVLAIIDRRLEDLDARGSGAR